MIENIINAGVNEDKSLRRWISEIPQFKDGLPDNVLFDKSLTGCGMTSVALLEDRKYVIAMPYVTLIKNKEEWCIKNGIEALGVYSDGHTAKDIEEFTGTKIMVTYDSLPRVVEALGEDVKNWKVFIDEYHELLHSSVYREEAVKIVLSNYKLFGSFIFGTATPIPIEYELPELNQIDKIKIKWVGVDPVIVNFTQWQHKDFYKRLAAICKRHVFNEIEGNAHIFMNSIKNIDSLCEILITKCKLLPEDITVTCALTDFNNELFKLYKLKPQVAGERVAKINFYTSTAFAGVDIFDLQGKTYIVTDGNKSHTAVDIETRLPQIIGRVRDSHFKNEINLFYSKSRYRGVSVHEFHQAVDKSLRKAHYHLEVYMREKNNPDAPLETLEFLFENCVSDSYITSNGEDLKVFYAKANFEKFSFATANATYKISESEDDDGFKDEEIRNTSSQPLIFFNVPSSAIDIHEAELGITPNFVTICEAYVELCAIKYGANPSKIIRYELLFPILKEARETIGIGKMKALKFQQKNIEREVRLTKSIAVLDSEIPAFLGYSVGTERELSVLKAEIQTAYDKFSIARTAKATDVEKWYTVKQIVRNKAGKRIKAVVIVNQHKGKEVKVKR